MHNFFLGHPVFIYLSIHLSFSGVKILGGFVEYTSQDSKTIYGKRFEWGTYYDENQLQGISHTLLSAVYCWLDIGAGYCYQYLVISSNITETEKGFNIKGGYVKFEDDGSVAMRWGISSVSSGFSDTIGASGKIPSADYRAANLHFILEQIDGPSQFDCFSSQNCKSQVACLNMKFIFGTTKNTSVAYQLGDFECYSPTAYRKCYYYIWV